MNPKDRKGSNTATARPLLGKTVLITRPKDQAGEFAQLLANEGANCVFVPTIQIVSPESWHQFDDALQTIESYDGIMFTSANGVRAFFKGMIDRGYAPVRKDLVDLTFYVVGEKTADALVAEGFTPIQLPGVENGHQLAEAIAHTEVRGKRFLFPGGNLASEDLIKTLLAGGAEVDQVIVYETVAPREEDATSIREKLESEKIDVATFFSPSSVKNLIATVPIELLSSKTIAVIGTSTEAAAREAGLPVHAVAARPTSSDLIEALVEYFKE